MSEFKKASKFTHLQSISPIDGRFRGNIEELSEYFSEYATMKLRVELEIEWLVHIVKILDKGLKKNDIKKLRSIVKDFNLKDAQWVEEKDLEINHDTKSAEYFVRKEMKKLGLEEYGPMVHIGLTSADIDSNVTVLSLKRFEEEYLSSKREIFIQVLSKLASNNKDSVFLARTHGRQAIPTTMGKELANYYNRLKGIDKKLREFKFEGKVTGAVGNWNALYDRYPNINWIKYNKEFIKGLDLKPNMFTTQILRYDNIIEYLHLIHQYNYVLIDLSKNIWTYVSEGYLKLQMKKEEVGSSTMAHKVNPISFEGCESHLLISSGIVEILARNLPTNRLQRDLTDKYLSRELGTIMVNAILGYSMIYGGITNVAFNQKFADEELSNHWEILSEPMQTILRTYGYEDAYEVIKDKTRGKTLTEDEYIKLVEGLDISKESKEELKKLRPEKYVGWARDIIKKI